MKVSSSLGAGIQAPAGNSDVPPTFTAPAPLLHPNSHAASKMWVCRGVEGAGSTRSSQAFVEKHKRWRARRPGGRKRCHPRAQAPHPHPARGCDRSLPLRPHYGGELPGLAEEPDGCGGGREASLAPWPGLNIYYVLFGLSGGKGGEDCLIDPELPARTGRVQGRGRCPGRCPPEPPRAGPDPALPGPTLPGRGLPAAEPLGCAGLQC